MEDTTIETHYMLKFTVYWCKHYSMNFKIRQLFHVVSIFMTIWKYFLVFDSGLMQRWHLISNVACKRFAKAFEIRLFVQWDFRLNYECFRFIVWSRKVSFINIAFEISIHPFTLSLATVGLISVLKHTKIKINWW